MAPSGLRALRILLVDESQAPKTIEVRLDGYRLADYSGINTDGAYEVWEWEIVGVMERDD